MLVEPKGMRVLILPDGDNLFTPAGIIMPSAYKPKDKSGVVKAVSKFCQDVIKVDEKVLYVSYEGEEVQVEGIDYILINIEHVVVVP